MTIDWGTGIIYVDRDTDTFFSPLGGGLYEMDTNAFRLALKGLEDSADGMTFPDTHRHVTETTLGTATYARVIELVNGYTITFLPDGPWTALLTGSNNNIADVKNVNSVSLVTSNSAGLVVAPVDPSGIGPAFWATEIEAGFSAEEMWRLMMSALVGKVSGANTTEMRFRDIDDTKDRIVASVDVFGNRSDVTKDGT